MNDGFDQKLHSILDEQANNRQPSQVKAKRENVVKFTMLLDVMAEDESTAS